MKNFLLLIILIFAISCSTKQVTHKPKTVTLYEFDFSEYSEKGFLFTPDSYNGEYKSKKLITIVISPEANKIKPQSNEDKAEIDPIYLGAGDSYLNSYWKVEKIEPDEILKEIYNKCISIDADAFVNFKIETDKKSVLVNKSPQLQYEEYIVSGFAIKRI